MKKNVQKTSFYGSVKELRNYILRNIRVWSLFHSTRLSRSALSTYYFGKLVFRLSVFCVFCVMSFEFNVMFIELQHLYNHFWYKCHLVIWLPQDTPGYLETKVFWNKDFSVIIPVHDVTRKVLSRDSNYITVVVKWPKFTNERSYHSFSFIKIRQKKIFLQWAALVQAQ